MQEIFKYLESGDYKFAFFAVIFIIIVNLRNILTFIDERKKRKLNIILEALNSANISGVLEKHLREEVEVEYFRLAHGVKLEKNKIEKLLSLKAFLKGRLPFHLILGARKYINNNEFSYGHANVNIGVFSIIGALFNLFTSIILVMMIYVLIDTDTSKNIPLISVAIIQVIFALYQFYQFLAALLLKVALKSAAS
ncbi:hypothetical protein [Photobacterium sanguinicancri]|uniref:hypothetical protein n=1 Tax=Photobacterium sanguinicancri TaxID=875932 RepID=UPI003D11F3E8